MPGDSVELSMPEQNDLVEHLMAWHGIGVPSPETIDDERALATEHRQRHSINSMVHVHDHRGMSHL